MKATRTNGSMCNKSTCPFIKARGTISIRLQDDITSKHGSWSGLGSAPEKEIPYETEGGDGWVEGIGTFYALGVRSYRDCSPCSPIVDIDCTLDISQSAALEAQFSSH